MRKSFAMVPPGSSFQNKPGTLTMEWNRTGWWFLRIVHQTFAAEIAVHFENGTDIGSEQIVCETIRWKGIWEGHILLKPFTSAKMIDSINDLNLRMTMNQVSGLPLSFLVCHVLFPRAKQPRKRKLFLADWGMFLTFEECLSVNCSTVCNNDFWFGAQLKICLSAAKSVNIS